MARMPSGMHHETIRQILIVGGSVRISARGYTVDTLQQLALSAAGSGATLILTDLGGLTAESMRGIATIGKRAGNTTGGGVLFDYVG